MYLTQLNRRHPTLTSTPVGLPQSHVGVRQNSATTSHAGVASRVRQLRLPSSQIRPSTVRTESVTWGACSLVTGYSVRLRTRTFVTFRDNADFRHVPRASVFASHLLTSLPEPGSRAAGQRENLREPRANSSLTIITLVFVTFIKLWKMIKLKKTN